MILDDMRLKVANMLLRRKSVKLKRQKILFDFTSAKYIGVLCSPQDEISTVHIKNFLQYLSQKGVKYSVFGCFDKNMIPANFLYWKGIDFITHHDLNLFYIPKNPIVDKFINEPFDMLISCNISNFFPMEYISQLSIAKCKVGVMHDDESCYDLMIDIKKDQTMAYFLKNLQVYLSNLRNPQ